MAYKIPHDLASLFPVRPDYLVFPTQFALAA